MVLSTRIGELGLQEQLGAPSTRGHRLADRRLDVVAPLVGGVDGTKPLRDGEGDELQVKNDAAGLKAMADDLDASAKKIEGVPLSIDKLKKYRDEYKGYMVEFAKAARATAAMQSGDSPDVAKLQEAMNNLNT